MGCRHARRDVISAVFCRNTWAYSWGVGKLGEMGFQLFSVGISGLIHWAEDTLGEI